MKTLVCLASLLISLCSLRAQIPAGTFTFTFSTNLPLFDLSGTVQTNSGNTTEQFTLVLSPQGRISGPFSATYNDSVVSLTIEGALRGVVVVSDATLKVVLGVHARFSGFASGHPVAGTEIVRGRFVADEETKMLVGRQVMTVCILGRGCRTTADNVSIPIPSDDGESSGSWTLTLNLSNAGKVITGSAVATLENGRSISFNVRGAYAPRSGISRLRLSGTGEASGVSMVMTTSSEMELLTLRGRLLGQRLQLP